MTIGDMTFKLGGVPPVELHLASSDGLAPLELPQTMPRALPRPSPDAIRRFQSALEEGGGSAPGNVANVGMLPIANTNVANWELKIETGNIGNNGDIPPPAAKSSAAPSAMEAEGGSAPGNVANVEMLPIANANVANWELGIETGNIGNNGNIPPPAAKSSAAPSAMEEDVGSAPGNVANVEMLPIANANVANWELEIGTGNIGNNGNIPLAQPPPAPPPTAPETPVSKAEAVAQGVDEIVEAVAARLLVTPALAQGDGEIRITLAPAVLGGSEIHLTAKAGELTVAITPTTQEAAQTAAAAVQRLETALAEHAPAFHHVAVVVASAKKGKMNETA